MVGDWTKEEADVATECVDAIFKALPKSRQMNFIGELNEALVFIGKAKEHAPAQKK